MFQRARATFDSTSNRNTARFHATALGLPIMNESTIEQGGGLPSILSERLNATIDEQDSAQ